MHSPLAYALFFGCYEKTEKFPYDSLSLSLQRKREIVFGNHRTPTERAYRNQQRPVALSEVFFVPMEQMLYQNVEV